jgi:TonB family protein
MRTGLLPAATSLLFASTFLSSPAQPTPTSSTTPPAAPQSADANANPGITPTDPPAVHHVGGPVSPPSLLHNVPPQFSEQARKAKFSGVVQVNLIVDANGLPQNVHIVRGAGMGLDEKAVEAVKQYKFRPAMLSGKPVPVTLNVIVNFQVFDHQPAGQDADYK